MEKDNKNLLMEDPNDDGLKAVMGSKFQDRTGDAPKKDAPEGPKKCVQSPPLPSTAAKAPAGGISRMNADPMAKLKNCVKRVWVYGAISALLFWWQQTGLLASEAAVPSFIVLAMMVGVQIGSVYRGYEHG